MSYFYGPVPSRRLGSSLGLELIPKKFCSFECLYCQVGKTSKKRLTRFAYADLGKLKQELKAIIKRGPRIDFITISGSGEPTLHKNLDKIIKAIRIITKSKIPVALITNSSLLYRRNLRRELRKLDLLIPSLDAADANTFTKINRPQRGVKLSQIINGLIEFRKEFKGEIWLEIMLIKGLNDSLQQAKKFKTIIDEIEPDKIQLNLPVRPPWQKVSLPAKLRLRKIKKIIGRKAEIIAFPVSGKTRTIL